MLDILEASLKISLRKFSGISCELGGSIAETPGCKYKKICFEKIFEAFVYVQIFLEKFLIVFLEEPMGKFQEIS